MADSVGPALLAILDTLTPAERVALVLHDVFGVPFAEIAPVVGPLRMRPRCSRAGRVAAEADPVRKKTLGAKSRKLCKAEVQQGFPLAVQSVQVHPGCRI